MAPSDTPSAAVPCIRCGTFVAAALALGTEVAVCDSCAAPRASGRDPLFTLAPAFVLARRAPPAAALTGLVVGAIDVLVFRKLAPIAPLFFSAGEQLFVFVVVPLLVFGVTMFAVCGWLPHGLRRWKLETMAAVGFAATREPTLVHGMYCHRRPRLTDVRNPLEVGLLAVDRRGLVVFGESKERVIIRREQIRRCRAIRVIALFPPRTALEVTLPDGVRRYFAPLERNSFADNRALVDALVERLGLGG